MAEPVPMDSAKAYAAPHDYMRAAQARGDVGLNELGIFVALRHRHVETVLSDANTRQMKLEMLALRGIGPGPLFDFYKNAMLFANGDVHVRRRQPMARTFAFKLMDGMRPRVAAIASEIISAHLGKGPLSFLDDFSRALPSRIIAEIIGAPPEDWPQFQAWVAAAARGIGFFKPEELPQIEAGVAALTDYVARLFEERRAKPREDFLTRYLHTTETEGILTEDEIRTQMAGVILAGSDTTRTGTAVVLSLLIQHKEQWAMVVADPDRWKRQAVEEALRFDPPVGSVSRIATRDFALDGVDIPQGRIAAVSLVAALRDPQAFPDPDRFDITREGLPRWNIAFGGGAHRCLGEALARAEMEEAIAAIARLAPNTRIIGRPPTILGHVAIRHIDQMTVEFAA